MKFLNIVYNVLVSPSEEFRLISMGPVPKDLLLAYGAVIVLLVSGLEVIYSQTVFSLEEIIFKLILASFAGVVFWLFTGAVFSAAAYVFSGDGKPQTFLTLTAYATLPWIFMPVVMQFKGVLGGIGNTFAIFGAFALWVWAVVLFLMAIKYTYNLSLEKTLLAASLPLLMVFMAAGWFGGFFFNLFRFL